MSRGLLHKKHALASCIAIDKSYELFEFHIFEFDHYYPLIIFLLCVFYIDITLVLAKGERKFDHELRRSEMTLFTLFKIAFEEKFWYVYNSLFTLIKSCLVLIIRKVVRYLARILLSLINLSHFI